ncbi:HPP family-domain-containing protein [Exophiala viscosa]|uniref:HPP family-domain-containing protein n=1 Tax=Exophiala viscosa TaxID=2486360 RepID=A0AAN6IE13_9EURO|nr:HPP family-domain-containing protein [Exophiala viscosa]
MSQSIPDQHSKQLPSPKVKAPFDIDEYLNPFIPRNPLYLLPTWMSYWFGYRATNSAPKQSTHRYALHTLTLYASVMIGAFCGLAIIENVFLALPPLSGHAVPIIVASFGAAAILEYNTIESPLSQPRNLIFGHFLSATVAVGITKLFEHLPPTRFDDLRWLAGALAVGVASMLMSFTKTVHPPAGATALLAATNADIQVLGWWLLPLVLLAASLMLASALVLNNAAGRRFPVYWWTPVDLKALREERRQEKLTRKDQDAEKGTSSGPPSEGMSDADTEAGSHVGDLRKVETGVSRSSMSGLSMARTTSYSAGSRVPHSNTQEHLSGEVGQGQDERIVITKDLITLPDWFEASDWEDEVLRILMERLRSRSSE